MSLPKLKNNMYVYIYIFSILAKGNYTAGNLWRSIKKFEVTEILCEKEHRLSENMILCL